MDLKALQKLQRDTGFNAVFLEKAYHITRILAAIPENEILAKALALKGGTALNFVRKRQA
jgi:predicted nucleotidyltransferase component of viral defense system